MKKCKWLFWEECAELAGGHSFRYERSNLLTKDTVWSCFTKEEMKQKYPKGGYKILGEVTKNKGANKEFVIIWDDNGNKLYLQPAGTYSYILYRTYGYIPVRDGLYVEAKKKNIAGKTIVLCMFILLLTLIVSIGLQ